MQANLGGIMFWSLEGDDFADKCNKGKYSLLSSAKAAMSNVIEYENEQEEQRKKDAECSESSVDSIPIISQAKSFVEWASGKSHCAKKTQENFSRKAPIISQLRSAVEAATGDLEAARQTQIAFLKNLEEQVDGTPGLGHAKAAIHCAAGQLEKCKVLQNLHFFSVFLAHQRRTLSLFEGQAKAKVVTNHRLYDLFTLTNSREYFFVTLTNYREFV